MIFQEVRFIIGKHDNDIRIKVLNKHTGPAVEEKYGKSISDELREHWDGRKWPCINPINDEAMKLLKELDDVRKDFTQIYEDLRSEIKREPTPNETYEAYVQFRLGKRTGLLDLIKLYIQGHPNLTQGSKDHYEIKVKRMIRLYQTEYRKQEVNYPIDRIDKEWVVMLEIYMGGTMKQDNGNSYQPSTLSKYMEKIIAMFNFATAIGLIKKNPFDDFIPRLSWKKEMRQHQKNRPAEMRKRFSGDHLKLFENKMPPNYITAMQKRCRLLALLQRWTGFSWIDMVEHDIRQLITKDLSGNDVIQYNRVKTGQLAIVPLFPETMAIIEQLQWNITPPSYSSYRTSINELLKLYGIPREKGDSSHMFRHIFGSMMLRRGFSMEAVSRMMGHESILETQKTYAVIDSDKIHADLKKIKAVEKIIDDNEESA